MQVTNFERITVNPNQMGGVPCIRGLRIPVATVLRMLAGGMTEQEILAEYPDLQIDDIRECLRFAAVNRSPIAGRTVAARKERQPARKNARRRVAPFIAG